MAAPPLDSPCDRPVTYPGDTKILVKSSKERGGTNFILRIKEQEARLNLHEHDDDGDEVIYKSFLKM